MYNTKTSGHLVYMTWGLSTSNPVSSVVNQVSYTLHFITHHSGVLKLERAAHRLVVGTGTMS